MKTYLLFIVLIGTLFAPMSFAQEPFEGHESRPEEPMEHEMHMRDMQLEQQQLELEMDYTLKFYALDNVECFAPAFGTLPIARDALWIALEAR